MRSADRPLSPHLQIYRWQLTSVLSILHRATGVALSGGAILLVWWLVAAAAGPEAYEGVAEVLGSLTGPLPLSLWFASAVIALAGADLETVQNWIARPLPAILLVLLLIALFYHTSLGLQVVIEDYVHMELAKLGLLIVTRLLCFGFAVAGIF